MRFTMRHLIWFARVMGLSAIFVVLVFIGSSFYHGSPSYALASLRGEEFAIRPRVADLGDVKTPSKLPVTFKLKNVTTRPIRLLGVQTTCSCTSVDNRFPVEVRSEETIDLRFVVDLRNETDNFAEGITVFSDSASSRKIYLRVIAHTRSSDSTGLPKRELLDPH
jgi:hypothetical protein